LSLWEFSETVAGLWRAGESTEREAEQLSAHEAALESSLAAVSLEGFECLRSQKESILLPGGNIVFAAALVLEPLSWVTVCLEVRPSILVHHNYIS
jgi:hypothetical protein